MDRNVWLFISGLIVGISILIGVVTPVSGDISGNFTATPLTGPAPLLVTFNGTSTGSPSLWEWDFDDTYSNNSTLVSQNATHGYTLDGIYNVKLHISDGIFSDNITKTINVTPASNFTAVPRTGPAPLNVSFVDQSKSTSNLTYNWIIGNDTGVVARSSQKNPEYRFTDPGKYFVNLTVNNSYQLYSSDNYSDYIIVGDPVPVANFTTIPNTGLAPLNVSFVDQSESASNLTYAWMIGNETGSIYTTTLKNPQYQFTTPGQYFANLTVTNEYGSTSSDNHTDIRVGSERYPSVNFAAIPENGTAPLRVSFVDQSELDPDIVATQGPAEYYWTFDGRNTSTEQNPEFVYTKPGTYTVLMNLSHGGILSGTVNKTINITNYLSPVANFTAVPNVGLAPLNVSFIDQSVSSSNLTYSWMIGNQTGVVYSSTLKNPQFQFTIPGKYYANLTVTNEYGKSSSDNYTAVTVGSVKYPSIDFAAVPESGEAPLRVSFVDQSVLDPDVVATQGLAQYYWTFDGRNESMDKNPNFTYTVPGEYQVQMNLTYGNHTDGGIRSGVVKHNITVSAPSGPIANFTAIPQYGSIPLNVTFLNNSTGAEPLHFNWTFGTPEDSQSYEMNPVHTFTRTGPQRVILNITDAYGRSSVQTQTINAVSLLSANFTAAPKTGPAPLNVSFIDQSAGNPTEWFWEFGDNFTSPKKNPDHQYLKNGTYVVNLTVRNGEEQSKYSEDITVGNSLYPIVDYSVVPGEGNAPLPVKFIDKTLYDPSVSKESYLNTWNFGDGTILKTIPGDTEYRYNNSSVTPYETSLSVSLNGTEVGSLNGVTVRVGDYPVPIGSFTASPMIGPAPLTVSFIDQSCRGSCPYSYLWNFGDGNSSTAKSPIYTYKAEGNYSVNMTITDAWGVKNTTSLGLPIRVLNESTQNGPINANFTVIPSSGRGVAPFEVQFMDTSSGSPAAWRWNFGDGSQITEQGPNHTYVSPGVYDVTLDIYNKTGGASHKKNPKFITALSPSVSAQISYVYVDVSNYKNIQFYDQSSGVGINEWTWDFGDGSTKVYDQNPVHEYVASGNYQVQLDISNGYAMDSKRFTIGIR